MFRILFFTLCLCLGLQAHADNLDKEISACKGAWDAVKNRDYKKAVKLADPKTCPHTLSFVTWKKLRSKEASSFSEYASFIEKHPDWPWIPSLLQKSEKALSSKTPATEVIRWFGKYSPRSASAAMIYLKALATTKNQDKLIAVARRTWHRLDFSANEQKAFLQAYGKYIRQEDHKLRASYLLDSLKLENTKKLLPLLNQQNKTLIQARLAFCENHDQAHEHLSKTQVTPELHYDQLRWYRKRDDLRGAELLKSIPSAKTLEKTWWRERAYFARESLNQNQPEQAYEIMASHPYKDGAEYADAEFFCGWVALRFLQNQTTALEHFHRFEHKSTLPKSKAKAAFWLARTYEVMGEKDKANEAYLEAARYPSTYYGMIAKRKFEQKIKLKFTKEPRFDPKEWELFLKKEFVQIPRLLKKAEMAIEAEPFLFLLAKNTAKENKTQKLMGLKIIREVYSPYLVFGSKDIRYQEADLFPWLYPRYALEANGRQQGIDPHLIHAIIRQESGFNAKITSPAGAMGMMQVMPATALSLAKKHGHKHQNRRLHDDPQYNILLGTHYLKEMLDEFEGSYVLAIAAYNCGPNPVKKWIERFGDPRTSQVDTIDFIESIPYAETREYVKSVLANFYVYQALEE